MNLTIDIRKLRDSGVGTYLTNLVPLVINAMPQVAFTLIGNTDDLALLPWTHGKNIRLVDYRRRPYSPIEQLEFPERVRFDTDLLWVPFINIPLFYHGRLLVTVYDLNFLALPQLLSRSQRLYARLMFSAIRRKAAHVLSISQFTKDEFLRYVPGRHDNVTVTLLGTPPQWQTASSAGQHAPHPRPFFLFLGNVKPHKNLARLIQAFKQIAGQVPHDLLIVGKKEGFIIADRSVEAAAAELGERIVFTGYLDDETLKSYFAQATALVFPSLYEGFGLPPLEAMACGCPTLVSNGSSLPEVCADASLYCDPYSVDDIAAKMLEIAHDTNLRNTLIARGKQRVAQLTWESCAEKTVAVINNLL